MDSSSLPQTKHKLPVPSATVKVGDLVGEIFRDNSNKFKFKILRAWSNERSQGVSTMLFESHLDQLALLKTAIHQKIISLRSGKGVKP